MTDTFSLYDNEIEKKQHGSAISHLSKEIAVSVEEITRVYENELGKLKERASVKDFLGVFAIRRVREVLKARHS